MEEFTSYISPNGTEYLFDEEERALFSEEGLGMPPITYITQKGPYQHGETILGYRLLPRTIQMTIRQDSCSREDYWANRTRLLESIKPNNLLYGSSLTGLLRKRFPSGAMRDLRVVIEQGPIFVARQLSPWDEWGFTEVLRFIAHDPLFFNPVETVFSFDALIDPTIETDLVFPIEFTDDTIIFGSSLGYQQKNLIYPGSWETFPTIVLTGPMLYFKILNNSTGKFIEFTYNIAAGDTVTFSLAPGNKFVTHSSGDSLIGSVTPESDLEIFSIAADPIAQGGLNDMRVTATGLTEASKIELFYTEKFIGI